MSKGSARRPGAIPDDAWERIFSAPEPVLVDPDEGDEEDDVPEVRLEPMVDGEGEGQ